MLTSKLLEVDMKLKIIILSMFSVVLLAFVGFYLQGLENEGKIESQIQHAVIEEFSEKVKDYSEYWTDRKMPVLKTYNLDGEEVTLSTRGKPSLYVVWASWCPDCQRELPFVNHVYKKYREEVDFITISLIGFRGETVEKAKGFYSNSKFEFPMFLDKDREAYMVLGVIAIPTVYIVNKEGVIKEVVVENIDNNRLQSLVDNLR